MSTKLLVIERAEGEQGIGAFFSISVGTSRVGEGFFQGFHRVSTGFHGFSQGPLGDPVPQYSATVPYHSPCSWEALSTLWGFPGAPLFSFLGGRGLAKRRDGLETSEGLVLDDGLWLLS